MTRQGSTYGYAQSDWDAAKREALAVLRDRASRRSGQTIAYSELVGEISSIVFDPHDPRLGHMLDEISRAENAEGRGMLSVLVVQMDTRTPGAGFFTLARELDRNVGDKLAFWSEEFKLVTNTHRPTTQE